MAVPAPNSEFTQLVTSTFKNRDNQVFDNLSNRNMLLKIMKEKGNMRKLDGGTSIVRNLDYDSNATYQRFSEWDRMNLSQAETLSAAEYQWRWVTINVSASKVEQLLNKGKSKIVDLAKYKIKNAIRTFNNNFSTDLYSDGTVSNQINGVQALISDAGTGTVGGINSTTFPFWKNKVQSAAAPIQGGGAVTVSSTTIENQIFLPLWLALDRGPDDQPDLVVMDNIYWQHFEGSQVSLKNYQNTSDADAGMLSLRYKNARCIYDGGSGIPASRAYFFNTNYFELAVHEDANFTMLEKRIPYDQMGEMVPFLWGGNLTVSNRSLQGIAKP